MPAITLVVCVHLQRDLLERLLRESQGCYDELIVLHDIPDAQDVRSVVEAAGGRFFERPPIFLQEPHWPFAWGQAKHDWILRLDADEFPGAELKQWLQEFRRAPEPPADISGYTCIWPMWDGRKAVTKNSPTGRLFLFHRQRVRFFGMCEQPPIPDGRCEALNLILHHQPPRKTYGFRNMLLRKQSRRGHEFITRCLLGKPDTSIARLEAVLLAAVEKRDNPFAAADLEQARRTAAYLDAHQFGHSLLEQLALRPFYYRVRFHEFRKYFGWKSACKK